ncbi:MAG: response regulator [Patescibacteria group bacterium]
MQKIRTVLIVEDELSLRRILKNELEKQGIAVIEAENGIAALPIALQEHPDLILLDVIMPKMHGIEFLDKVKNDEWGKTVPVVVLTNFAEDPKVVEAVREGRCEVLSKSDVKLSQIIELVKLKVGE